MKLVGFTGSMGVGKSTAIEILREAQDNHVQVVKFAQPLYDIQEFAYRRIEPVYKRPGGFTKDRKLLQWIGTDWGRDTLGDTIWVDLWRAEVERLAATRCVVATDDVRYDNEVSAVRAAGGKLIKIVSNRSSERIDTVSGISGHKSEHGIGSNLVDVVIENNGTLSDFKIALVRAYDQLGLI